MRTEEWPTGGGEGEDRNIIVAEQPGGRKKGSPSFGQMGRRGWSSTQLVHEVTSDKAHRTEPLYVKGREESPGGVSAGAIRLVAVPTVVRRFNLIFFLAFLFRGTGKLALWLCWVERRQASWFCKPPHFHSFRISNALIPGSQGTMHPFQACIRKEIKRNSFSLSENLGVV